MRIYRSGHFSAASPHERSIDGILESVPGERKFKLTREQANLFRSRAVNLYERQQNKPSTQILTYNLESSPEPYQDLNRYITNLRKTYKLNSYCSALEVTQKKQFHFHLIVDMPYVKTAVLNTAWCAATNTKMRNNAIRDHRLIRSEIAVLKYCSDYLTKKSSKDHDLRKFSYSQNATGGEFVDVPDDIVYMLKQKGKLKVLQEVELEYCKVGRFYLDENIKEIFDQLSYN